MDQERWKALERARRAIQARTCSYRGAVVQFGVKLSSLHRHVKNLPPVPVKHGADTLLTAEEEEGLVETILWRSRRGLCMDLDELRYLAREVVIGAKRPIAVSSPGRNWTFGFLKRHKTRISVRKGQILSLQRFLESDEDVLSSFYSNLVDAIGDLPPRRVWNCDETGGCAQGHAAGRVLSGKGQHANVLRSGDKGNVSVMVCVAADGSSVPHLYIHPGKEINPRWMDGAMEGSVCTVTDSSYINMTVFHQWLQFFDKHLTKLAVQRPVVLLLDNHFSHITRTTLEYARDHKIDIFALPSQTSHFTQPLDNAPFRTMKAALERALKQFPLHNKARRPTRCDMASLFSTAFAAVKRSTIVAGFENTGIYPPNRSIIMQNCVADKAPVINLPHVERLVNIHAQQKLEPLDLSKRTQAKLIRDGLSPETLNVIYLGSQMTSAISPPTKGKDATKKARSYIKGGMLMTRPEMIQLVADREIEKARLENEKEDKRKLREEAKLEREEKAREAKRKRSELVEERKRKRVRDDFDREVRQLIAAQEKADRQEKKLELQRERAARDATRRSNCQARGKRKVATCLSMEDVPPCADVERSTDNNPSNDSTVHASVEFFSAVV